MVEAAGIPVGLAVDGANRNDCKLLESTVDSVPIDKPCPTVEDPQGVCLDKAYDHQFIRDALQDRGLTAHNRSRGEEVRDLREDPLRRARRWVVERVHSWINRYRSLLVRWSKKDENHEALLMFCFALISWQQLGVMRQSGQALRRTALRAACLSVFPASPEVLDHLSIGFHMRTE